MARTCRACGLTMTQGAFGEDDYVCARCIARGHDGRPDDGDDLIDIDGAEEAWCEDCHGLGVIEESDDDMPGEEAECPSCSGRGRRGLVVFFGCDLALDEDDLANLARQVRDRAHVAGGKKARKLKKGALRALGVL